MATLAQRRALVRVTVDHATVEVASGTMLLEAIRLVGGRAPTLCLDKRHAAVGACPVCLVGAARARGPVPARWLGVEVQRWPARTRSAATNATCIWCACTRCASRAGGASARAARCRVRSRGRRPAADAKRTCRLDGGFRGSTCVSCGACADTY